MCCLMVEVACKVAIEDAEPPKLLWASACLQDELMARWVKTDLRYLFLDEYHPMVLSMFNIFFGCSLGDLGFLTHTNGVNRGLAY